MNRNIRGLKLYTVVVTYEDGKEDVVLKAPIFEIDNNTQQYKNVNQFLESLVRKGKIKRNKKVCDVKIKSTLFGKTRTKELLFEDDAKIPVNTKSLNLHSNHSGCRKCTSLLLLPCHLLKYKRYRAYRNLYTSLKNKSVIKVKKK